MPIQRGSRYYRSKTVLVTGATGLVGKALIEAILRKLPDVTKIYALIRRHDRPVAQILEQDVLGSSAFDTLRMRHGEDFLAFARGRVEAIEGDLASDGLGLSGDDHRRLAAEVDLVINSAALAVFDARLDHAFATNTLGPSRILDFARGAAKRPFVAHISTCYVNNRPGPIFETLPDPDAGFSLEEEIDALARRVARIGDKPEALVDEGMRWARKRGWSDTYTFTKSLGERMFLRDKGDVPGLIFRPSIIESALRAPAPGWIDGFRMLDPILISFARRQLFDFPGNPEAVLDLIPCDIVIDALLMCIPHAHAGGKTVLYHCASGMENPLLQKDLRRYLHEYYERRPLRGSNGSGLPSVTLPELDTFLRHLDLQLLWPLRMLRSAVAPLRVSDWGNRRHTTIAKQIARLERLRSMATIYGPYTQSRARFMTFNLRAVWDALADDDKRAFHCSVAPVSWRRYLQEVHLPGVERYLLRMSRTPVAPETPVWQAPPAGERWSKAARLLDQTRTVGAEEASTWTTPAYKKVLRRASRRLIRGICHRRLELEVSGLETTPAREPFIVVANHSSHLDTCVLLTALDHLGDRIHPTAAADYWFRSPFLAWFLHSTLGAIPFDRHARNVARALSLPTQILRNGHSLIFYPEGTRSPDGKIHEFRSTVGLLALASGAPIVPAYIANAAGALAKGERFLKHHPVGVHFDRPIAIAPRLRQLGTTSVANVAREIAHDAQAAVEALRDGKPASRGAGGLEHIDPRHTVSAKDIAQ